MPNSTILKHTVHVKDINSSKKLPHIPDTEKVEKLYWGTIQAVGAVQPRFYDRVVVNLELEALDGTEIYFSGRHSSKRHRFRISADTENTCWSR